jgi:hypothetical protein
MQLEVWFNRITYFLSEEYLPGDTASTPASVLPNYKPPSPRIGTLVVREFTFECADNQIIRGDEKILYNLENRMWYYCEEFIYDLKTVLYEYRKGLLTVWFVMRNADYKIVDTFKKVYVVDKSYDVNPISSDYQPRKYAVEHFHDRFGCDAVQTEKFFRAFYFSCLEKTYNDNPSALQGRKPVNKALLERLWQHTLNMWETKNFSAIYELAPICIIDQNLERTDRPQDQVGNIVILLKRKVPRNGRLYDEYRW